MLAYESAVTVMGFPVLACMHLFVSTAFTVFASVRACMRWFVLGMHVPMSDNC